MADLKGTKTEANLQTAFAGESMARNKYTYFASKARKDGYVQIAKIFEETAANEKEHAKIWFKLLNGGIDDTITNLKAAAAGENYEWTDMYAAFAREAREEGLRPYRRPVRDGRRDRKGARGTLPQAARQCRKRSGVLARRRLHLAVLELRSHCRRQTGARHLSGLRPSAGIF